MSVAPTSPSPDEGHGFHSGDLPTVYGVDRARAFTNGIGKGSAKSWG